MGEAVQRAGDAELPQGKLGRTRLRLVAAIRDEVSATGNFSAESVAERAGISVATFYNHFASKDEALVAAYSALMRELVALLAEQCRIERLLDLGLRDFLAEWLVRAVDFFRSNSALFRLAQAATTTSAGMREVFRTHESEALDNYQRFIQLGQAANVVRAGDREALASVLLVMSESWNHPSMRHAGIASALHDEWVESLHRMLAPEAI